MILGNNNLITLKGGSTKNNYLLKGGSMTFLLSATVDNIWTIGPYRWSIRVDGYDTFWAIIKCCLADSIFLVRIPEKWDNMQS